MHPPATRKWQAPPWYQSTDVEKASPIGMGGMIWSAAELFCIDFAATAI